MPTSLIELRPNRRLLDHEFEGYKLNLQALPHFGYNLVSSVDKVFPSESQYSFVHAKLFALHNHLVHDHWDYCSSYYYVDVKQQVRHIAFDVTGHTFENTAVYDVPAHVERKPGHFNLCLSFPSTNIAVVSDGTGYLHIAGTGSRNRNQTWQTLHSSLVLGDDKFFVIVDTRAQEKENVEIIHCLLQSVEQSEEYFNSVLTWVTFENDGERWKQSSMKQLQGKGIVHYAAIESSCTGLYVASDYSFTYTFDSEKEIVEPQKDEPKLILYTWLQSSEDITITLKLESNFDKKQLHVSVSPLTIKVSYAGKTFIDGKLSSSVDSELTTWNIQDDGQVDILVTKSNSAFWDQLIQGGDRNGEQIIDANLTEEVHKRLAHLCSETEVPPVDSALSFSTQELEECDAVSEEDTVLARFDTVNHEVTHKIPLSVHQYLFSIKLENHEPPAFALRHDVDACIWQPYSQLINSVTWPVKHQGTLMAFGYVQSSKQNRKFVTCSPNFQYSVVCESTRHIFIYRSAGTSNSQLRRRTEGTTKNVKIGQQHVFNIEQYGEVLGVNASNDYLFVLTEKHFIAIELI